DENVRDRFLGEAQAANRIEHVNIVQITDFREAEDKTLYLVMELLRGDSLRSHLEKNPNGIEKILALRVARDTALALSAAHKQGIVHRDLKPENLMLCEGPEATVKILDFGIAKILYNPNKEDLTNPKLTPFLGTTEYAAPEQFGDPKYSDSADPKLQETAA